MRRFIAVALSVFLASPLWAQETIVGSGYLGIAPSGVPSVVAFTTPLFMSVGTLPSSGTSYNMMFGIEGVAWNATTTTGRATPIPIAGTFSGLEVSSPTVAMTGGTETISLSGLTGTAPNCALSNGVSACADHSNSATVSADCAPVALSAVASSPTGTLTGPTQVAVAFKGSNANESFILGGSSGNMSATAAQYTGFYTWTAAASPLVDQTIALIVPDAGTIDKLCVIINGTAGSGAWYQFTVFKNGVATNIVAGDSTDCGGASSTTCKDTAGCSASTPCTHNISVVAGDSISIQECPTNATGCPAGSAPTARTALWGLRWMPTTNKHAVVMGMPQGFPSNTANQVRYLIPAGTGTNTGDTTAPPAQIVFPYTTLTQTYSGLIAGYCFASTTARTLTLELQPTPTDTLTVSYPPSAPASATCPSNDGTQIPNHTGTGTLTVTGPTTDATLAYFKHTNPASGLAAYTAFKYSMIAVVQ